MRRLVEPELGEPGGSGKGTVIAGGGRKKAFFPEGEDGGLARNRPGEETAKELLVAAVHPPPLLHLPHGKGTTAASSGSTGVTPGHERAGPGTTSTASTATRSPRVPTASLSPRSDGSACMDRRSSGSRGHPSLPRSRRASQDTAEEGMARMRVKSTSSGRGRRGGSAGRNRHQPVQRKSAGAALDGDEARSRRHSLSETRQLCSPPTPTFDGWRCTRRPEIALKDLQIKAQLGKGHFGNVMLVCWAPREKRGGSGSTSLSSSPRYGGSVVTPDGSGKRLEAKGELFALKVLEQHRFRTAAQEKLVLQEKATMAKLTSPFHLELVNTYKTTERLYLLAEFVPGGDVWNLLKGNRLDLDTARFYAANILLALEHMHDAHIIHRDVKLENLLIASNGYLKLCDFGFAKELPVGSSTRTFLGTYAYLSPEFCRHEPYDHSVDIWAFGICLFQMLFGFTPFESRRHDPQGWLTMRNIEVQALIFPKDKDFPLSGRLLIKNLLTKDKKSRLGAHMDYDKVRQHAFFRGLDWESIRCHEFQPPVPRTTPRLLS